MASENVAAPAALPLYRLAKAIMVMTISVRAARTICSVPGWLVSYNRKNCMT